MKKTVSVILAVLMCTALLFTGCSDKNPTDSEQVSDKNLNGSLHTANDIAGEGGEAVSEVSQASDIATFISGKFYLEGTMYTEDSKDGMNVNIAMDSADNGQKAIQITTTMSGIYLGIFYDGSKTYVINIAQKIYLELTDGIRKTLGLGDIDMNMDFSTDDSATTKYYNVTINGEKGICTEVTSSEGTITKLYTIGDKLLQVDSYDKDNTLISRIVVSALSPSIPSNQLTLSGLTKASSFYNFFSSMGKG